MLLKLFFAPFNKSAFAIQGDKIHPALFTVRARRCDRSAVIDVASYDAGGSAAERGSSTGNLSMAFRVQYGDDGAVFKRLYTPAAHLYARLPDRLTARPPACPSARPSARPPVHPSVRLVSLRLNGKASTKSRGLWTLRRALHNS